MAKETKTERAGAQPAQERPVKRIPVQYVTDREGKRVAVILPIEEFEELVEAAEQRDDIIHLLQNKEVEGEPISLEEFEARLHAEGKLL